MVFLLYSRNFSYITKHLSRFITESVKINEGVSKLDKSGQTIINVEVKNELSTLTKLPQRNSETINSFLEKFDSFLPQSISQCGLSFWRKSQNLPVKCKVKRNDFGKKIAEPYVAKKPTPINFERLTKDLNLHSDYECEKLQKTSTKSETERRVTRNCLRSQIKSSNALTKYEQRKEKCHNVYRGDKIACSNQFSSTAEKNTEYETAFESKKIKVKTIANNLISKLKSMKLMRPSGFISEELITEAIFKLRNNFPEKKRHLEDLASVKTTLATIKMPNCEKSLVIKFGDQSKSKQFPTQKKFAESILFDKIPERTSLTCSKIWTERNIVISGLALTNSGAGIAGDNMNRTNNRSNLKVKKTEDCNAESKRHSIAKPYQDSITIQGDVSPRYLNASKNNKKLRKPTTYKPKSRHGGRLGRCKRRFSFSKIPIQPNVKGSVIFVDNAMQPLDDPCKILSVNFFKNDTSMATEDQKKGDDGIKPYVTVLNQYTAIKANSNGCIKNAEAKRISIRTKILQGCSENRKESEKDNVENTPKLDDKKKQYFEGEILVDLKTKRYDNSQKNEEKYFKTYSPTEPIIRRKKISKLDKNITSFVTTVFPEERLSKSLSKFKNTSVQKKYGFISLDNDVEETQTKVSIVEQNHEFDELREQEKSKSTSSIGSDFYRKMANIPNFNSEGSILRSIEAIDSKGRKFMANLSKPVFGKGNTVSPGLTRPVTQKTAHLDILKTKPFSPISNTWKNSTASSGRIPSAKANSRKKKAMRSKNDVALLETNDHKMQQTRRKSSSSWKSKCDCEEKCSLDDRKDYDKKANDLYPLPSNWDYEGAAPPELVRKWATMQCRPEKDVGCPITSEDMKHGPPCKRPSSAAAINRCNFNECRNRIARKKLKCGNRPHRNPFKAKC